MRKRLYILVSLIALAGAVTVAEPDGGVSSRIEAAASAPQVEGEVGKIVFVAGSTDTVFNVYSRAQVTESSAGGVTLSEAPRRLFTREIPLKAG